MAEYIVGTDEHEGHWYTGFSLQQKPYETIGETVMYVNEVSNE